MPKCDFNCNFIEIALRHGCYPVNLLRIFRTPFPMNTSGGQIIRKKNGLPEPPSGSATVY